MKPSQQFETIPAPEKSLHSNDTARAVVVICTVLLDVLVIVAAALVAAYLRNKDPAAGTSLNLIAAILPVYLLAGATFGAYRLLTLSNMSRSLQRSLLTFFFAGVFGMVAAFAFKVTDNYSRLETGYLVILIVVGLALGRVALATLIYQFLRAALDPSIVIIGDSGVVPDAAPQSIRTTTYNVRDSNWRPAPDDPAFLELVYRVVQHADRVLLLFAEPAERRAWVNTMQLACVHAEVVEPELSHVPLGVSQWSGLPTLVISRGRLELHERIIKRMFDFALVLALSPITFPVIAICAILVKLGSPGPAFFIQERVGRNNRRYLCYKLRTMRSESTDPQGGRSTSPDDDRVTPFGRFLRRTSIDELPQLINVLIGDMSLVGPRPHALGSRAEGALFWEIVPGYWSRHAMKPGLTGLAQTRGLRGATSSRQDVEQRVAADLEYINRWSIWLDMKILIRTVGVLIHRNAF